MSLDALKKQYAGAYADDFEWPQPSSCSDEDDVEETEGAFLYLNWGFQSFFFILTAERCPFLPFYIHSFYRNGMCSKQSTGSSGYRLSA